MDVWVKINPDNAIKVVRALKEFGFAVPELSPELFLKEDQIVRMGVPPLRLEILTTISGVDFTAQARSWQNHQQTRIQNHK